MEAHHLLENQSREFTMEMIRLAEEDWGGTGSCLFDLRIEAAQYDQAEEDRRKRLSEAEDVRRNMVEDESSKEWKDAMFAGSMVTFNLGIVLEAQGKYDEAGPLSIRAIEIAEKVLGPEHPSFPKTLNNRALLLAKQGKWDEAETLFERCQAIQGKVLGPGHPSGPKPSTTGRGCWSVR
ncbi:unnamed protein product [Ectocarpus sp. 12 AP-2014]